MTLRQAFAFVSTRRAAEAIADADLIPGKIQRLSKRISCSGH
jgi:hypothetical protein